MREHLRRYAARYLLALIAVVCVARAWTAKGHTNDTDVGRIPLAHPDQGHEGGATLHGKVRTAWTILSDELNSRWKEVSILDTATETITHGFDVAFTDLRIILYDGQGSSATRITKFTTPDTSDFTVAANGSNPRTQIDITNNSGGDEDLTVLIIHGDEYFPELIVETYVEYLDEGESRYYEDSATGSNYQGFKSPASVTANTIWTLPDGDGSGNQVLGTNGSKALQWQDALTDPMTTRGDILHRDSSNVTNPLPIGGANSVLSSDGTDPSWDSTPAVISIQTDNIYDTAGTGAPGFPAGLSASGQAIDADSIAVDTITDEAGTGKPDFSLGLAADSIDMNHTTLNVIKATVANADLRLVGGDTAGQVTIRPNDASPNYIVVYPGYVEINSGVELRANTISDSAGTGDPYFPDGINVGGGTAITDTVHADTIVDEAGTGEPTFSYGLSAAGQAIDADSIAVDTITDEAGTGDPDFSNGLTSDFVDIDGSAGSGGNVPYDCTIRSTASATACGTNVDQDCNSGEIVTGGGANVTSGIPGYTLRNYPADSDTWRVHIQDSGSCMMRTYAVCCKY